MSTSISKCFQLPNGNVGKTHIPVFFFPLTMHPPCDTLAVLGQLVQFIQLRKAVKAVLHLNYRDGRPIYEQVKDGLRQLVISGAIRPGDKLPSVRSMAAQLAINPNTIQKAYEALEQEGYVYSIPGKGSFAADRSEVEDKRREELLAQLSKVVQELRFLGVTDEEISAACGRKEEAP